MYVPQLEDEAMRDLSRAREDAKRAETRAHFIQKRTAGAVPPSRSSRRSPLYTPAKAAEAAGRLNRVGRCANSLHGNVIDPEVGNHTGIVRRAELDPDRLPPVVPEAEVALLYVVDPLIQVAENGERGE